MTRPILACVAVLACLCLAEVAGGQCGNGCSDGTREGFRDYATYPDLAGCSGAWTIPGLHTESPGIAPACPGLITYDTTVPACARISGNDSANPLGIDCTAEDLCALGWHVCRSGAEVVDRALEEGCNGSVQPGDPPLFFAARVTSNGCGACANGTRTDPDCDSHSCTTGCLQTAITANDFWGCGNYGTILLSDCAPFERYSTNLCAGFAGSTWSCDDPGTADDVGYCEIYTALKTGPEYGGVLCCRDTIGGGTDRPPTVSCPPLVSGVPDAPGEGSVTVLATVTDDCDPNPLVTNDRTAGGADASGVYPCGSTLVTFTATDNMGHRGTCKTLVEILDPALPAELSGWNATAPLRVATVPADPASLRVTFGAPAEASSGWDLYRGTILPDRFVAYDHTPLTCYGIPDPATPGLVESLVPSDPGTSHYYLASASNCLGESSRGLRSDGTERPALPTDCGPRR